LVEIRISVIASNSLTPCFYFAERRKG